MCLIMGEIKQVEHWPLVNLPEHGTCDGCDAEPEPRFCDDREQKINAKRMLYNGWKPMTAAEAHAFIAHDAGVETADAVIDWFAQGDN